MRWTSIVPALMFSACAVGADTSRPTMPLPGAWSTASAGGAVDPRWWSRFGSRELDDLMTRSVTGSFTLQAARARIDEARALAQIAGAPLYPSLDLTTTAAAGVGPSATRVSGAFVAASYELDFWGKQRATAGSARALADASAFDAQTAAITLEASVADTYFEILSLRERVQLARQIAEDARRVLALVRAQAEAGVASDLEIAQQENAVATFDAAVPALEAQLDTDLHLLATLVGATPESIAVATSSTTSLSIPEVAAGLPASMLARRPDVASAEARLQSAHFDIARSRAAFLPSVTLTGEAGVGNSGLAAFFPPAAIASLVAGLVQPIFHGGALRGQLAYDRAHAVELAAAYRQAVLAALADVEDALSTSQHARELETADQQAVESARRASALARTRFEAGTVDFLTVLSAERTLYEAEDALLTTRLQRLDAAVGLYRALGGGFAADGRTS